MSVVDNLPLELAVPFHELSRDIRDAANMLGQQEARYLVDTFYLVQSERIRVSSQYRATCRPWLKAHGFSDDFLEAITTGGCRKLDYVVRLLRTGQRAAAIEADGLPNGWHRETLPEASPVAGEPNRLLLWTFNAMELLEKTLALALGRFAGQYRVGQWMTAQCGVGPIISAGMLAHYDIRKAPTAGHYWSFAGLSPHIVWERGQKRPYNAALKSLAAFRLGECFVKTSTLPQSVYGKVYAQQKGRLIERNNAGLMANYAKAEIQRCEKNPALLKKMQEKARWEDWENGRLCKQHIHDWARRVAVKLFLSHLHQVSYEDYHGCKVPCPWVFRDENKTEHAHLIEPPLWPGTYSGKPLRDLLES